MIRPMISASMAFSVKLVSRVFYRFETEWVKPPVEKKPWKDVRLFVLLNHTSLYEPLLFGSFPNVFLWQGSRRAVIPEADKTLKRPLVGKFFKFLTPKTVCITRKRDDSWEKFKNTISEKSMVAIFPEGRMMRRNGLDSNGKPMSVKGGIADVLSQIREGKMIVAYSGGLHHIQAPGELLPKVFKKISVRYESIKIEDYIESMKAKGGDFKKQVISDMEERISQYCPPRIKEI